MEPMTHRGTFLSQYSSLLVKLHFTFLARFNKPPTCTGIFVVVVQAPAPQVRVQAILPSGRDFKTPTDRSNPATYTGIMDDVRKAFAAVNHVDAGLFSFNSKGACPNCQGLGVTYTDLGFLEGVKLPCEVCDGKRFKDEVLAYTWNGKSIADVLNLTVHQALAFLKIKEVQSKLQALSDVGLDYLTLGQPLSTLSGGECQRIKLASELHKQGSIYVMDEPTTGLHLSDIGRLLTIMNRLVDGGNTVIVIEHNLDVIRNADWIIDMGPEGGNKGGMVI